MKILILLLSFTIVHSYCSYITPQGCTPYGLRLALGRSYSSGNDEEAISIWFNTRLECPKSYVTIEKRSSIKKVYCETKKVNFGNFSSFIHRCSINFIERGDSFEYMAFGWTGSSQESAEPFKNTNIKSYLLNDNQTIKMLVLADWSYLELKSGQYDRLDGAFERLLKSNDQPNIIYMNGDYAYDLSSNNGINYDNFLIMLSQIAAVWPCILNTGNHEYKTTNDYMLFTSTFQLYNLTLNNVTTLNLGTFSLIMIDPYGVAYQNISKQQILSNFQNNLKNARKDKPIIVGSHYPLACSGAAKDCSEMKIILKQFFDLMIDFNAVLYLGAHYHTYERIYPYTKQGEFKIIPSPYTLTKSTKYLISIVQGIAGNDKSIVQSYSKIMNYTAALSYGHTGFGIIQVDSTRLVYRHLKGTNIQNVEDSAIIEYSQLFSISKQLREE